MSRHHLVDAEAGGATGSLHREAAAQRRVVEHVLEGPGDFLCVLVIDEDRRGAGDLTMSRDVGGDDGSTSASASSTGSPKPSQRESDATTVARR